MKRPTTKRKQLTPAEAGALQHVLDWLGVYSSGRWCSLLDVFRGRQRAGRKLVRRLCRAGVLKAHGVELRGECVRIAAGVRGGAA